MSSGLTRRSLLSAAPLLMLGGAATRSAWAEAEPRPLPIPPLIDSRGGKTVALAAQHGQTEFLAGRASPSAGYNGSYLGPTLRVHRGDDVPFEVTSRLKEDTTVHWHGLLIPAELDGGPHNTIAPGQTWRPVLPIRQPATTAWFRLVSSAPMASS